VNGIYLNLAKSILAFMQHSYLICILSFLIFIHTTKAQDTPFKKVNYTWDPSMLEKIEPEAIFKNAPAIILSEKITASLPLIEHESTLFLDKNYYLTKAIRVLINSEEAIKRYSSFYMPEVQDYFLDPGSKKFCYNFNDWSNSNNEYRIMIFAVRLVKKDGSIILPELSDRNEVDSIYNTIMPSPRIRTNFKIKSLSIGDEFQLVYKIEIPVRGNLDYRFFFNSIDPKQNYELSIDFPSWIKSDIHFYKDAKLKYDSTLVTENKVEKVKYNWKRKNLQAYDYNSSYANVESLSFVDIELFSGVSVTPIYIRVDTYDGALISNQLSRNSKKHVPYFYDNKYNSYTIFRQCMSKGSIGLLAAPILYYDLIGFKDKPSNKSYNLSKNTTSNVGYRHFFKSAVLDSSYANDYFKMIAIHNKLNELPAIDYKKTFNDKRYLALNTYEFLERNLLRVDFTNDIYFSLFYRLDSVYYYSIFPDKRLKNFHPKRASVTIPSRNIFAFRMNNNFYYLHPQNTYSKYHLNELPFYFENELVVHIPQNINSIEKCSEINSAVDVIYSYTPASQGIDNIRQIVGAIKIDVANNNLNFNGKVTLSGQYSTLLRNYYQNNLIDPTINEDYKIRMSDNADKKSVDYTLTSSSSDYPFKTYYSASYSIPSVATKVSEINTINIQTWFHYVYPDTNFVNSKNHQFDFFPDFLSTDKFRYQLSFDKGVEILNINNYNIEVHNEYADFHAVLKKIDDSNYMFDSSLEIKQDHVPAENIRAVEELSQALDKFVNSKLQYKQL
jgi:hypothetical protein